MIDLEYLQRGLDRRVETSVASTRRDVDQMMAMMAGKGMLGSGATLLKLREISIDNLVRWFQDAAQFTFTVTGSHQGEAVERLRNSSDLLREGIEEFLRERRRNTGLPERLVEDQLAISFSDMLKRQIELLDDFEHGMLGSEKMKKDPLVSIVANQTSSPGAVQQIGVGQFSQTALVQNYHPLLQAIDAAIASEEFNALQQGQKDAFTDVADALKDEAAKPTPNVNKLRRWGQRLLELGQDFGMKVATSTIAQVLAKIFMG